MQSPTQANSGSNPPTTSGQPPDTEAEAQPAHCHPHAQQEETVSPDEAHEETETATAPEDNQAPVQTAERPARVADTETTEAVAKETTAVHPPSASSENPGGTDTAGSALRPSASKVSDPNVNPQSDGQTAKKHDKGLRDGRKYVPSKKAMIDPLKMDMSKPLVMPLTSSQLSLQCIECHIIFSDHKSKERHLKSSHPAEYEQCILRNALFACYVCDRHFTNSTELMVHQKAHTEKKPFKCPICGVAFNKSSELTVHKKIHFGQDGYACTDCGKPCKTLTLLKYHRRTHTGERPYICKECGKRFTMSKALQKHIVSHLPEGAEEEEGDATAKAQHKKNDGASTVRFSCSLCKANFKSNKTRLHHMKTKHSVLPAAATDALPAGQQLRQSAPTITPISICQAGLLQVEPNGPLQKVDSNIDTEQIRRLIESLGNVQKVNQVVILGQVPPHASPLELQQISQLAEPIHLVPPQMDFTGLNQSEGKTVELATFNHQCDSMETTIILEPITPDGQLENPSFSELGSHMGPVENIELTFVQHEQTETPEGEVTHQIHAIQSDPVDHMVCQNELEALKQNLEQTVILELTPALIPTLELEQSQAVPQNEIPSSSLVPTTELENTPAQTVIEQDTSLSSLMPTVELELATLQTEQRDLSSCPFARLDTLTQNKRKSDQKEDVNSQVQAVSLAIHSVMDIAAPQETHDKPEPAPSESEPSNKLLVEHKEGEERSPEAEDTSAKEVPSQGETRQGPQISELPVNVMSAQELVKVRKRKPARAFIFQGYIHEQFRSIYKDDLQIDAKPAKRQRKKSHLVVKFGPQIKEKKNRKQKKPTQQLQTTREEEMPANLPAKKTATQKKVRKGKIDRKMGQLVSTAEKKSPSSTRPQMQQIKDHTRKRKMKKQKEEAREAMVQMSEHKTITSPVFKKSKQAKIMRKNQPKNTKDGKRRKNPAKEEKADPKTSTASDDVQGPPITQDSLLLLKGHKQPQLKVYKLDPSKAPGQTQEASPHESHTMSQQRKDETRPSESADETAAGGNKKGGRPKKNQKAPSLLSPLQVSHQPPATLPTRPKTTRKRKASLKIETEGVITSRSKRILECKDCGERFGELSSLQKHKATVHVVESPGLTYTNGNVFEGVSRLDLYQLPTRGDKVAGPMGAAADWDTEPELAELALEDRERSVSFPALIPSPSFPAPPPDVEVRLNEDRDGSNTEDDGGTRTSTEVRPPAELLQTSEVPTNVTVESASSSSSQTQNVEKEGEAKRDEGTTKKPRSESGAQVTTGEDVGEDLLLEVDLVTIGEQYERENRTSSQERVPQNKSKETCNTEVGSIEKRSEPVQVDETAAGTSPTSQTVSCSTHEVEIKEEEEELSVQRRDKAGTEAVARGRTRRARQPKKGATSRPRSGGGGGSVGETESEKEQDACRVVYETQPIASDSEIHDEEEEAGPNGSQPAASPDSEDDRTAPPVASLPLGPSTLEGCAEGRVVSPLESATAGVEAVTSEGGPQGAEEDDGEGDRSPAIVLEKYLPSRQSEAADEELRPSNRTRDLDSSECQEIKVEESSSDPLRAGAQRDIRTVLVKEESSPVPNEAPASQGSRRLRWNVEPVIDENTDTLFTQSGDAARDSRVTPEFNATQCIFYPVKEEEREVLLGSAQSPRGTLSPEGSSAAHQSELQGAEGALYEGSHVTQDYQEIRVGGLVSEPVLSEFADAQDEDDAERPDPTDLQNFLLQSSDEEESGAFQLSDPQLDSEAEVMSYFYKNKNDVAQQPDQTSQNLSASTSRLQSPSDYFSEYFSWDTWVEIANCTNELSSTSNAVTAREVAQFVGIHIAMGTLKFPSPKLYWEDLTKVPLIAEAMTLSRFLELSRTLKFACPTKDPVNSRVQEGSHDCNGPNGQQDKTLPVTSPHGDGQSQREKRNESSCPKTQTDPLWRVRPLLCRFKAGCRSLRREGQYAVDQYLLPLTGKPRENKLSLRCTTLIGFGGLLLHVDLEPSSSDKEDAVEKMVPKGSVVFLCKQELSTPAMLERLLVAGVHGAGRVGGARGQIGDEFVSSDGKLMLRRSNCGFILSTAGNGQRSMGSLIDNFEKAQMSARLNRDLRKLYPIALAASAPNCWPQAVLWYVTDLALVNSWLLYREDRGKASAPLTLMAFRLEVSKTLILSSGDTQDSVPPQPAMEKAHTSNETPNPSLVEDSPLPDAATRYDGSGHWPEQLGEGEGGRCRFRDCQRTSRVLCLKCCVFLCISRNHNCFLNFHNQANFGTE